MGEGTELIISESYSVAKVSAEAKNFSNDGEEIPINVTMTFGVHLADDALGLEVCVNRTGDDADIIAAVRGVYMLSEPATQEQQLEILSSWAGPRTLAATQLKLNELAASIDRAVVPFPKDMESAFAPEAFAEFFG
ncbi:hypothetical protein [Corynebacterium aurimucosum]|uniref:Uncharacterized protein n=1 Tax=Corynebacterium aurimucosum (strain ATCC 700975 / DSM 44827 / CIP 107346 / CN-1) TaxID=548476 RepID=C3PHR0_CORA7|nr:hypothetical protein [Corynebacterium aurimucosum]ACP33364.1 hypothetical protein cauri_1771 [Corynebacterium aurimucosum ATCC 700975]QQU92524.1 hypothetical protein I6I67_09830 [Corynebacterium aurimucosum]